MIGFTRVSIGINIIKNCTIKERKMNYKIREMKAEDKQAVKEMMRVFYASAAVSTNGSEEIFENDINACLGDNPLLSGYVFEGENGLLGFAMTAAGFSTESGSECVWIEDLYIKEEHRHKGIGGAFLDYIKEKHNGLPVKLEVETENETALRVYEKHGFKILPYRVMKT